MRGARRLIWASTVGAGFAVLVLGGFLIGAHPRPTDIRFGSLALALGGLVLPVVLIFWLLPTVLMKAFQMSDGFLSNLNRVAVVVALLSAAMGVVAGLLMIWAPEHHATNGKILGTSVVLFAGSAAVLCTIKFFYHNRDHEQ